VRARRNQGQQHREGNDKAGNGHEVVSCLNGGAV
jgi:hypothetical protein